MPIEGKRQKEVIPDRAMSVMVIGLAPVLPFIGPQSFKSPQDGAFFALQQPWPLTIFALHDSTMR